MKLNLAPEARPDRGTRATSARPILISHRLCPYVQRVAIVLAEKSADFERRTIDLAMKPDWFLEVSPLGKTPVLLVHGQAIFESAVICEYLEDTLSPGLHPESPLSRARHRAWVEFGSALLAQIAAFYNAADEAVLAARASDIGLRFTQLEAALGAGPYFGGEPFSVVDAAFAPAFRYFDLFDTIGDFGFWSRVSRVRAWRSALADRPSVIGAVDADYPDALRDFLHRRGSALSKRMSNRPDAAISPCGPVRA